MKKMIGLLVTLLLCLYAVAFADSVPSKIIDDLTRFEVEAENLSGDAVFFIRPIMDDEEEYQEQVEICQNAISTLMQAESITEFFGEVKDASGEVVDLVALLESENLNVYEFCALNAEGYEGYYGAVTAKMLFATPYEKDEKVVVLIGMVTANQDGTQSIEWTAYEGMGVEAEDAGVEGQGCIQVKLNPEIVIKIQEGTALLAIVSK